MQGSERPIAISVGEPAGIGPDLVLEILQSQPEQSLRIFADPDCLATRARQLGLAFNPEKLPGGVELTPIPLKKPAIAGELDPDNANSVLECIKQATEACINKTCRALVTGPVHKGVINEAGFSFRGHTEYLAQLTQTKKTVMLLASPKLKVALVTTHLPLSKVSKAITKTELTRCIEILDHDLQTRFHIPSPKILVCGLNPHAGEGGHLGDEEIKVIIPTLEALREKDYRLIGPVSADTAFRESSLKEVDVVLAMYHDQGLPPLKAQSFGEAVNITLGLPIVRTSVDHGVALSLAGTGKANADSFKMAIHYADIL